jgi:hypothetical protein
MNTVQSTQEKRTIKVKDFLEDFRSGTSDQDLQLKYHLTPLGLEKFYGMLMEREILTAEELQSNYRGQKTEDKDSDYGTSGSSSFICPQCLASHETMFDLCPNCGVSFQQMIGEEPIVRAQKAGSRTELQSAKPGLADMDAALEGIFSAQLERASAQPPRPVPAEEEFCGRPGSVLDGEFQPGDDFGKFRGGLEDSPDEVVPGMPLDYAAPCSEALETSEVLCDGCKTHMEPVVRDVYDRQRSIKALAAAGILFVLGFLAAAGLHFFSGYSFARLVVVYSTGMFLLFGSVLLTVGTFLFLAREKAYCCPSCKRVYPRG